MRRASSSAVIAASSRPTCPISCPSAPANGFSQGITAVVTIEVTSSARVAIVISPSPAYGGGPTVDAKETAIWATGGGDGQRSRVSDCPSRSSSSPIVGFGPSFTKDAGEADEPLRLTFKRTRRDGPTFGFITTVGITTSETARDRSCSTARCPFLGPSPRQGTTSFKRP